MQVARRKICRADNGPIDLSRMLAGYVLPYANCEDLERLARPENLVKTSPSRFSGQQFLKFCARVC